MYTREILPPIASPVQDGKPVIGTWNRAFERVDLQEISKPFRSPLPRWVKDFRIKEWQCFSAQNNYFLLDAIFCNVKMYRMAQVLLYDREKEQKFIYRKIIPGTGWQLPKSLANSSVDSRSMSFFFRIHNWLDADTVKLDINIEASRKHPPLTVHLAYDMSSQNVTPMAASLGFSKQRIMYAYKALAPVRGDMVLGGKRIILKQESCSGVFYDCKGFFPYRMHTSICNASGFDDENKRRFGFHIAENQTMDTNKNNENALWVNGKLTPLPPVRITMPNGLDSNWIIQDVEGMVDLAFTPKEPHNSGVKLMFTRADFNVFLGYYNGILINSEGEKIVIKNLFGIGEKLYLRV
jgi:hypothetical protein